MGINQQESKKLAGERAVDFVQDGQIVGLGTGSTIYYALIALGREVSKGLDIRGVPTSIATEELALNLGIPIINLNTVSTVDVLMDGADEIDRDFNMIKGGGGALTREKLVALAANKRITVVDKGKLVSRLGENFLLPVEVLPFAWRQVMYKLTDLNCQPKLREREDKLFETDNGNYIVDCKFDGIDDAEELEKRIKLIPGVVESGLFVGITDILIIGSPQKIEVRFKPYKKTDKLKKV